MSIQETVDDWPIAALQNTEQINGILQHDLLGEFDRAHLRSSRTSREHLRPNLTYEVDMHDSQFLAEYTPSEETGDGPLIVRLPGIGQALDDESEERLHDHLAASFPGSGILSIGSNSIGIHGSRDRANREQTASDRLEFLLSLLPEDKEVVFVGTSMGAQTVHDMLSQNAILSHKKLHVGGIVYFAPALVTPDLTSTREKTFWTGLALTSVRELAMEHPTAKLRTLRNFGKYILQVVGNSPSVLHQVGQLRRGTAEHEMTANAQSCPIHVIAGEDDPLTEGKMRQIWENMPNVTTTWIRGAGHEAVFLPHITRPTIRRALQPMCARKQ